MWVFLWPGRVRVSTSHTGGRKLPLTRPVTSFNPLCDPSDTQRGFTAHPWPSHTHAEQRGSVQCLKKNLLLMRLCRHSDPQNLYTHWSHPPSTKPRCHHVSHSPGGRLCQMSDPFHLWNRSVVRSINCEKMVRNVDQCVPKPTMTSSNVLLRL